MTKLLALIEKHPRLTAILAGGISATGFAPLGLWPITLLCFALLMHLIVSADGGRRALLIGWLFGIGHFCVGNNWIATAFTYQSNMPVWLGWIAVFLLSLYLAVYPALACGAAWWISKRIDRASINPSFILIFAGCWIVTEWLRSWVFTGFAWNPLAAAMAGLIAAPASWTGSYGFSGMILILIGSGLLLAHRQIKAAFTVFIPLFLLWTAALVHSSLAGLEIPNKEPPKPQLTIVQPNISQIDKYAPGYEAKNFARLARYSQPENDTPRILFWPEAAIPWWIEDGYPPYVYLDQPGSSAEGTRALLARLLGPDDILLTGIDRLEFDKNEDLVGARNAVLVMDAKGKISGAYNKAHLVPFGEYLALRWLLEPLGVTRLVPGDIDFWPGPGARTLSLGKGRPRVGIQICYEIIFSGQVVDRTNRPDFIFNPSNEAWFGSWGQPQFLAQAQLRAVEEGLPVIRSTPTGISAVIDADGVVRKSLPHLKAGRIDAGLPIAKRATLFALYGNALPLAFAALLIGLALLPLARRRLSR
jgi:apolipoprotein N-acyltransferase